MSRFVSKQKLLVGVLVVSSLGIGYAMGAQPRMDAALALLQNARAELEAAVPNKGGHRERAIELVDRAIVQVRDHALAATTHNRFLEHDPEKWVSVFRKDHAPARSKAR